MIVIRNRDHSLALTARAGEAGLKQGMVVKFDGVTANGTPKVVKASDADLADATVQKGIVWYREKDSLTADFEYDPATLTLTPLDMEIPEDAQVAVFTGKMVVAYHTSVLPSALVNAPALSKVSFDGTTGFPTLVTDAEPVFGFVERKDGPEITMVLNL